MKQFDEVWNYVILRRATLSRKENKFRRASRSRDIEVHNRCRIDFHKITIGKFTFFNLGKTMRFLSISR